MLPQSQSNTIARLREENDELREEILQLRALLTPPATIPTSWRLTALETRLVCALARSNGRALSTEHLLASVYGPDHERSRESLHVMLVKVRRKQPHHGLEITTQWGVGICMSPASCAAVRRAIAGEETVDAPSPDLPPIGASSAPQAVAA